MPSASRAKSPKFHPDIPYRYQRPSDLSQHLLPPRMHVGRKLKWKQKQNCNQGALIGDVDIPNGSLLLHKTRPTSEFIFFNVSVLSWKWHQVLSYSQSFLGTFGKSQTQFSGTLQGGSCICTNLNSSLAVCHCHPPMGAGELSGPLWWTCTVWLLCIYFHTPECNS